MKFVNQCITNDYCINLLLGVKMSPENSKKLIEIYPELFADIHHLEPFSLFGFECGNGWFDLLKNCITEIKEVCLRGKLKVKIAQIKEKYGELRFYVEFPCQENSEGIDTTKIYDAIHKAEHKSVETCENCGKTGIVRKKGLWVSVRCEECKK